MLSHRTAPRSASSRSLPSTRALLCAALLLGLSACGDCGTEDPGPVKPGQRDDQGMSRDQGADLDASMPTDSDTSRDSGNDSGTLDMKTATDSGSDLADLGGDQGRDQGGMDQGSPDMDPGVSLCPRDLRSSCLASALSCFGDSAEIDTCARDPFLDQREALFRSGATGIYRQRMVSGQSRREFRTISPGGQMCYLAIAQEEGMPMSWELRDGATMFKHYVAFVGDEVRITCASGNIEVCSRTKFDLYFTWPETIPEPCPDKSPQDLCDNDTDCASGELCCALGQGMGKQCAQDDVCITTRTPRACVQDDDCSASEVCRRCDRAGRECVPLGFVDDPNNSLSCEPDQCDPNMSGACSEPRTCCINGGSFACVVPSECDSPPDPNPVCQPSAAQACVDPQQQCCYVSQLNQFRCIDQAATCRTNVCFADTDCPSNQECCNANAAAGTAGTCLDQCANMDTTCTMDADCSGVGSGAFCCRYPGYTVGTCELIAENCDIITCANGPQACNAGNTCCNAAPLTTPVCVTVGSTCPPEPVAP